MKNHRSKSWTALFVLTALVTGITCSRADSGDVLIYSGKEDFRPNWVITGWGGANTSASSKDGRTPGTGYVSSAIDDKSQPWSGIAFHVAYGQDQSANSIPLTPELNATGAVELYINNGKALAGHESEEIKVKLVVLFMTKDGKQVPASTDTFTTLDTDAKSWEAIRVPLATLLAKVPDASIITGVAGVNLQYFETPTSEIRVTDCYLKAK